MPSTTTCSASGFREVCETKSIDSTEPTGGLDPQIDTNPGRIGAIQTSPTSQSPEERPTTSRHVSITNTEVPTSTTSAHGTTSPTSAPSLPNVSSGGGLQGVSKGAVAGIAISTAIIGAAIALLAVFFSLKRRKRSSNDPYGDYTSEYGSHLNVKNTPYVQVSQSAGPLPVAAAAATPAKRDLDLANLSNSSDFLAGVLPPAADEQAIKAKVAELFSRFQRHVDSFYRDVHNTMTPTMEADLARFGANLVAILESSSFPTVAVKHALAGYILSIVSPEAEDQGTLFPSEIAGLKESERSNDPENQAAYILYKRLAVRLHSSNARAIQSRQGDIREAAEHFALTFFPWANPTFQEQEKDEELVRIITDTLNVSIWLYGQPYLYDFVWESVGRRGTVVAPGLVRLTDEKGRVMERPQILLEPTVISS